MKFHRFVCLLALFTTNVVWAATGTVHGTVTAGLNRTPIANASIVLRGEGSALSTTTSSDGTFAFHEVNQGSAYSLTVEAQGLATFTRQGLVVSPNQTQEIDAHTDLANTHSDVLVTDGVVDLDSTGSEISQTISSAEVAEAPSITRNAAKYALLDPHVRQTLGLGANYDDSNRLSINAGSYRHTSYELDGLINYDWVYAVTPVANVAPASVDEVKVLTGTYPAQFGNSTNGIISIETKSGGAATHGDYFAYLRPGGTQAEPLLATFHIPNQKLDWGAAQGGPLFKPSTRYFASYERVQADRGAVLTSPTRGFFDGRSNQYSGLLKLDHDLSAANIVTLRLNGDHYATNNADDRVAGINNPTYGRTAKVQSWGGQISDQAVIGKAVNIARFAYTSYVPDSATPLSTSPGVVVPNYLQEGYSTYSWVHGKTEQAADIYAFDHGLQSIKLGGELAVLRVKDYSYSPLGTYYYQSAADYLNQTPYKYAQTYGTAYIRYGQQTFNMFVEDDIKLRPALTVNLGLRYEFQSITSSGRNFGPRLGLAWDVTGDGHTVIRAAGGIYFDQYYMYLNLRFITLGPHSPQYNYTWNCAATPDACPTYPNAVESPSGGVASPFVSYLYVPGSKLLNPYALQFSLSLQQQLAKNTILTLSALNVHTLKQMRVYDINHPAPFLRTQPGQVRSVAAANATRPFTTYDGVNNVTLVDQIVNTGSSLYQSFDAALSQRLGRWGMVNGHYVFSGSYTYSMFYADYNSGVPNEWLPDSDRYERGPSDFYQRHRFIADTVLHGWYNTTLALVGNFGSGLPVNPITGVDNNGDGYTVDRPVGLGRNSFRAPAQRTMDASLAKQFPLHERLALDVRAQAFNVLNSRNLISVNNIYGNGATPLASFLAPQAGITNSDPSRQLEGVVRIRF
jgi:hypothetical protein